MQVSKKVVDPTITLKLQSSLSQLIVDTVTPDEASELLETLFSETERIAIIKRLGIAIMLQEHKPYEVIKNQLRVSSATIATVQSLMSQPGMLVLLEKVKISFMADNLSSKLKNFFSVFNRNNAK